MSVAPSIKTNKRDLTNMHEIRPRGAVPRRARSTVLAVLAAVTMGLTTTGMAPVRQDADEKPQQIGKVGQTDRPDAPTPATEASSFPKVSGERCEPTRLGSKERKAGAAEACVSTSPAPVKSASRGMLPQTGLMAMSSLADEGGTDSCKITNPGNYAYERFQYCVTGLNVLYTLRDAEGKQIGTGTLEVSTSAKLPEKGTTWDEHVTVKMTGATGAVTALSAKFRSACTQNCTATKTAPWYGGNLTMGQSVSGTVSYSSNPAPDSQVEFTTSYKLYVTAPGAQITDPNAAWNNPRKIRCDDAVRDVTGKPNGKPSPGCVIPTVTPVVEMSTRPYVKGSPDSGQGAAAASYLWAQHNLVDGWGIKKPLTRAKYNEEDRRAYTCGNRASVKFGDLKEMLPDDSCDEFPFASTHEGGTDGGLCAEIIPVFENGGWKILELGDPTPNPNRHCIRAHVPGPENSSAGSVVRWGYEKQRILDSEEFMLNITS